MRSEFELIERFRKIIPRKMQGLIPIGDDTGVIFSRSNLKTSSAPLLFTTDTLVDGIDFLSSQIKPERAGHKAVAVNLSDIAAMGGTPVAFVAALGIPKGFSQSWVENFTRGMVASAKKHKVLFVGGDISRAKEFFASISMIGMACNGKGPVLRSGAKPGDWIAVTGHLGGSILKHHYDFQPRIAEGRFLAGSGVNAMIDISDGLAQDLGHILKSSRAGAEVDIRFIPPSRDAVTLAKGRCWETLQHSLCDGEDFELLFTAGEIQKNRIDKNWKKKFPQTRLSWIGKIRKEKGLRWLDCGKPVSLPFSTEGFRHL